MNIEKPQARSLLLCDYLVVEEGTRNVSLINCFTRKAFEQFPTPPITICAYSPLSGGFGEFHIRLRIAHLRSLQWEYENSQKMMFLDRLSEVRYSRRLQGIRFPEPGSYSFSLLIEEEMIADTRIEILKREA